MNEVRPSFPGPPKMGPPASHFYCLWIEARDGDPVRYADDPVEFYDELDAERWSIRCVRIFRDGMAKAHCYANPDWRHVMPEAPFPPADEFSQQAGFLAKEITAEEFEAVWRAARAGAA